MVTEKLSSWLYRMSATWYLWATTSVEGNPVELESILQMGMMKQENFQIP